MYIKDNKTYLNKDRYLERCAIELVTHGEYGNFFKWSENNKRLLTNNFCQELMCELLKNYMDKNDANLLNNTKSYYDVFSYLIGICKNPIDSRGLIPLQIFAHGHLELLKKSLLFATIEDFCDFKKMNKISNFVEELCDFNQYSYRLDDLKIDKKRNNVFLYLLENFTFEQLHTTKKQILTTIIEKNSPKNSIKIIDKLNITIDEIKDIIEYNLTTNTKNNIKTRYLDDWVDYIKTVTEVKTLNHLTTNYQQHKKTTLL